MENKKFRGVKSRTLQRARNRKTVLWYLSGPCHGPRRSDVRVNTPLQSANFNVQPVPFVLLSLVTISASDVSPGRIVWGLVGMSGCVGVAGSQVFLKSSTVLDGTNKNVNIGDRISPSVVCASHIANTFSITLLYWTRNSRSTAKRNIERDYILFLWQIISPYSSCSADLVTIVTWSLSGNQRSADDTVLEEHPEGYAL